MQAVMIVAWLSVESRGQPWGRAGLGQGIAGSIRNCVLHNTLMMAQVYMPGGYCISITSCWLLPFSFPQWKRGKHGVLENWPNLQIWHSNTFFKFCNSMFIFVNYTFQFQLQEYASAVGKITARHCLVPELRLSNLYGIGWFSLLDNNCSWDESGTWEAT